MTDSLPKERLDELDDLAGRATPGPWHWCESSRELLAPFAEVVFGPDDDPEEDDGEFMAALDPDTVRALIADARRVQEAEAKLEQVREWCDSRGVYVGDEDSDWYAGYRQAQRENIIAAERLRESLDQTKEG